MIQENIRAHGWTSFRLWSDQLLPEIKKEGDRRKLRNATLWTIRYDPLPLEHGGFRPGTQVEGIDMPYMVAGDCFTPGALLENAGETYVVLTGLFLRDSRGQLWRANTSAKTIEKVSDQCQSASRGMKSG